MAITWYTSAGQPSDSTGADGDLNWDTTNRITWGPKGKVTSGSWLGTAYSNIGPTGPAQLSGTGTPGSGLGQIGNGYCDVASGLTYLKSSSGWTQTGSIIGPQGLTGPSSLSAMSAGVGAFSSITNVTISSTPYVLPYIGTTIANQFTPLSASALVGVSTYTSIACTLTLYNVTTSSAIYTVNLAANVNTAGTYFNVTQYPIPQGHTVQWQVTGSGSQSMSVQPYYLMPSSSSGICVQSIPPAGFSTNQTFSTTAVGLPYFGSTARWAHVPARTGGIYGAQATYIPASGTSASSSVSIVMQYSTLNGSTSGTQSVPWSSVTATGLPQTILQPRLTDFSSLSAGYFYTFTATGSGSGTLSVSLLALV